MNWKTIINDFNTLQVKHKQLNSFGVGDIKQLIYLTQNRDKVENVENNAPIYPLMYVLPGSVQQDEQYTTYNFNILICDIMNVKNYDIQNQLLSDTLEITQDILAQFKYSVTALQGDYYTDKYDITLPTNISPFMEAYDDILVGWNLPISIVVQTPLNRCIAPFNDWDVTPSPTPTNTSTPTNTPSNTPTNTPTLTTTPTITPSNTCPVTTQYLQVILGGCHNFSLSLYNDAGFTSNATALCDYVISGTAYGDMGTIYNGTETILSGQHNHNFNLNPVLQPGECVTGFTTNSYTITTCQCPVVLVLP